MRSDCSSAADSLLNLVEPLRNLCIFFPHLDDNEELPSRLAENLFRMPSFPVLIDVLKVTQLMTGRPRGEWFR